MSAAKRYKKLLLVEKFGTGMDKRDFFLWTGWTILRSRFRKVCLFDVMWRMPRAWVNYFVTTSLLISLVYIVVP